MSTWLAPVLAYLAQGLVVTLATSAASVVLATVLGLLLGLASQSGTRWIIWPVRVFVEVFRGVPSLLILLFVFFALPQIGVPTSALAASVLGLGLWGAANIAEVSRGALTSISHRQWQAARALGMAYVPTLTYVILPQAIRRAIPPYIGQITVIVQASTLTSVVGVTDVLGSAKFMIERLAYVGGESHAILIYGFVLLAFFIICYPLTVASKLMEKRFR